MIDNDIKLFCRFFYVPHPLYGVLTDIVNDTKYDENTCNWMIPITFLYIFIDCIQKKKRQSCNDQDNIS